MQYSQIDLPAGPNRRRPIFKPRVNLPTDFQMFPSNPVFTVATVRPACLINSEFISKYVERGCVYVLAVDTSVDRHNTLCVVAGRLTFSVHRETFWQLGLQGKRCPLSSSSEFYIVEIELSRLSKTPDDPEYSRLLWSLSRMSACRVIAVHVLDGQTHRVDFPSQHCVSSSDAACVASFQDFASLRTPTMAEFSSPAPQEAISDLFEWLGLVHGGCCSAASTSALDDEFPCGLRSPQELEWFHSCGCLHEVSTVRESVPFS
jgi:hypothetical protein